MGELEIRIKELNASKSELISRLRDAYEIEQSIKIISKYQGRDNQDLENITESVYGFFLLFHTLRKKLVNLKYSKKPALIYSLYVASQYGDDLLELRQTHNYMLRNSFKGYVLNFSDNYPSFRDKLMRLYTETIRANKNRDIKTITKDFFEWLKESSKSGENDNVVEDSGLKDLIVKVEGMKRVYDFNHSHLTSTTHKEKFTWDDFGGYDEVVGYFKELTFLIQNHEHATEHIPIENLYPSGILLYGPPGTGKTTLAKIFCHMAKAPFTMLGVSEIGSTYVFGASIKLQEKFDEAAKYIIKGKHKISILYIDELDVIAPIRGFSNNEEKDNVVATLNYNMDGHLRVPGVIVLASTNRLDRIDPALLRPGRFSKQFYLGYADKETVKKIFKAQINRRKRLVEKPPYTDDLDLDFMIEKYYDRGNWTGALVNNMLNELEKNKLLEHLKDNKPYIITEEDVEKIILKYVNNTGVNYEEKLGANR